MRRFFYIVLIACITSVSWANEDKIVHIYGQNLSAMDVLNTALDQADLRMDGSLVDPYDFRKDYDDYVTMKQVFSSYKTYHQKYNHRILEIMYRGHRKYILKDLGLSSEAIAAKKELVKREQPRIIEKAAPSPKLPELVNPKKHLLVAPVMRKINRPDLNVKKHDQGSAQILSFELMKDRNLQGTIFMGQKVGGQQEPHDLDVLPAITSRKQKFKKRVRAQVHSELSELFMRGMPFAGIQSGFLAPDVLPSKVLGVNEVEVKVRLGIAKDDYRVPGQMDRIDSELMTIGLTGQVNLFAGMDVVGGLDFGVHTGDFVIGGASNQDLNADIGDMRLGVRYLLPRWHRFELPDDHQVMSAIDIKLPTGRSGTLLGSENFDFSASAAYQVEWMEWLASLQIGISQYGHNEAFASVDTRDISPHVLLALQWSSGLDYTLHGGLFVSANPFDDEATQISVFEDELSSLRMGASYKHLVGLLSVEISLGLTDSVSDVGAMLYWTPNLKF